MRTRGAMVRRAKPRDGHPWALKRSQRCALQARITGQCAATLAGLRDASSFKHWKVIRAAALARWQEAGATHEQMELLRGVRVELADLPVELLELARATSVLVDINAAGHGRFVDPTPNDDEEFAPSGDSSMSARAVGGSVATGVDLLTTLMHEFGHQLGLGHSIQEDTDLMHATLGPGERRLPMPRLTDELFANW